MNARIKTPIQVRREREYRKILTMYDSLTASRPSLGTYSKYAIVARSFRRSVNGIRLIIETSKVAQL